MDGALSEDYTCYVLNRGSSLKLRLQNLDPAKLSRDCAVDVGRLIAGNVGMKDFRADSVCRNPKAIQAKIKELLNGISVGQKCGPGDF